MPISVNENGVVKPLGSNILYERQIRYIPRHTKYQALTGHDCVIGNVDLFCTIDLSFVPDYVFVKKPAYNNIFRQIDSHSTYTSSSNNWLYYAYTSTGYGGFHHIVILTPVHSRHNMSETERDATFTFTYDASNVTESTQNPYVNLSPGFELIDNTVKCYFNINSGMGVHASRVTNGIGFGHPDINNSLYGSLEFEVEAFGNCQPTAV